MLKTTLTTLALFLILPAAAQALLLAETKTERETHQILGGGPIQEGEFPYVLALRIEGVGRCTATLISRHWLLTAGHCVTDDDGTTVAASRIRISLSGFRDNPGFTAIGRVIVHPEHRTTPANRVDLALLEIPSGFPYNVQPVTIADISQETDAYLKDTPATAVGWGQIAGERYPPTLHKVGIPWWTAQDCIKERLIVLPSVVHDRTLCAGFGKNEGPAAAGPATGDSGSPLLVPTTEGGWVQVGVTSTVTVGRAGGVDWVPVYMRLTSFHDWIYSYVEKDERAPPTPGLTVLTHVFAGPLATSTAKTEITITNRSGEPCSATVRFHQGTAEAPRVRFNLGSMPGLVRYPDNNTLEISIPAVSSLQQQIQARAEKLTLTRGAGQALAVGAVYIQNSPDCAADALHVSARYLITRRDGEIMETFSILPQAPADWLSDGDCRLLAVDFGPNSNVGLAMVTAEPDRPAPEETRLTFQEYDWQGNLMLGSLPPLEVTGKQHALNPWSFTEPRLIRVCLDSPFDAPGDNRFRLSLIAIAASSSPRNVQYSAQPLIRLD